MEKELTHYWKQEGNEHKLYIQYGDDANWAATLIPGDMVNEKGERKYAIEEALTIYTRHSIGMGNFDVNTYDHRHRYTHYDKDIEKAKEFVESVYCYGIEICINELLELYIELDPKKSVNKLLYMIGLAERAVNAEKEQ